MMESMKGKVVLITGGGKGIGYGVARAFARAGASIALTGRTLSTLEEAAKNLRADFDADVMFVQADGGDEASVKNVLSEVVKKYGHLDCLINNAQSSKSGMKLKDHTKEDFDLAIYTGLYATFFYMREAYPYLKESHGSVINFASGAGLAGRDGQSSYAAAKEGIRGLSRVAATEWGPYGVRVNVICPLAMTEGLQKFKEEYPDRYEQTIKAVPMGRFADPETDIGRLCIFLSSEDAAYITGETITVQGGSGLRP